MTSIQKELLNDAIKQLSAAIKFTTDPFVLTGIGDAIGLMSDIMQFENHKKKEN